MSILYESYAKPQVKTLARVKDTERTLTITLAAGKGVVISATCYDEKGVEITKAYPGQEISPSASIRNDGDKDTIWVTFKDKDTGTYLKWPDGTIIGTSVVLDRGKITTYGFGWTMPNKNFNILIEAGHGT